MANLDLDAARHARREAGGEPPTVTFGGEQFTLPVEVPLSFADLLVKGEVVEAIVALLGADQATRFMDHGPTIPDFETLAEQFGGLYGLSLGEASPWPGSSNGIGTRLRPTSNAATGSTSAASVTANGR
jgi:hypothetical protein